MPNHRDRTCPPFAVTCPIAALTLPIAAVTRARLAQTLLHAATTSVTQLPARQSSRGVALANAAPASVNASSECVSHLSCVQEDKRIASGVSPRTAAESITPHFQGGGGGG